MNPPDEHGAPYENQPAQPSNLDRRAPHWFDKWINPTTVIALVGGIIWGVQLNMAVVQHTDQLGGQKEALLRVEQMMIEYSNNQIQLATILDSLVKQVEKNSDDFEEHNKEAEVWKRRILQNQARNHSYQIPDDGGIP